MKTYKLGNEEVKVMLKFFNVDNVDDLNVKLNKINHALYDNKLVELED